MTKLIAGIIAIFLSTIVLGGLMLFIWGVGIYNSAQERVTLIEAKTKDNESQFDNLWKQINQVTQVSEKNKDALKEVLIGYADARNNKGAGAVMSWVQESVPNADLTIYKQLANLISSKRDFFTARQSELIDYCRVHNAELRKFPQGPILKFLGFKEIEAQVITSSRAKEAIESGKDDNVELFK